MGKNYSQTCYACEGSATTREHAPAKCFFDTFKNNNINLITVPSCENHNNRKNGLDSIVSSTLRSTTNHNTWHEDKKDKFIKTWDQSEKPLIIENEIVSFKDEDSVHEYFRLMSKALFFHKTGEKLYNIYPHYTGFLQFQTGNQELKFSSNFETASLINKTFNNSNINYNQISDEFKFRTMNSEEELYFESVFYEQIFFITRFSKEYKEFEYSSAPPR